MKCIGPFINKQFNRKPISVDIIPVSIDIIAAGVDIIPVYVDIIAVSVDTIAVGVDIIAVGVDTIIIRMTITIVLRSSPYQSVVFVAWTLFSHIYSLNSIFVLSRKESYYRQ